MKIRRDGTWHSSSILVRACTIILDNTDMCSTLHILGYTVHTVTVSSQVSLDLHTALYFVNPLVLVAVTIIFDSLS